MTPQETIQWNKPGDPPELYLRRGQDTIMRLPCCSVEIGIQGGNSQRHIDRICHKCVIGLCQKWAPILLCAEWVCLLLNRNPEYSRAHSLDCTQNSYRTKRSLIPLLHYGPRVFNTEQSQVCSGITPLFCTAEVYRVVVGSTRHICGGVNAS